jgi:hypothetical protein
MKKILFGSTRRVFSLAFLLITLLFAGLVSPTFAAPVDSLSIPLNVAFGNYDPARIADFGTVEISQTQGTKVQFTISGLSSGAGGDNTDLYKFYFNTTRDIEFLKIDSIDPSGRLDYEFDNNDPLFKADGSGFFDGVIDWSSGNPQVDHAEFVFSTLTGDSIFVNDFLAWSTESDKGMFLVAALLQSTDFDPDGIINSEFVGGVPIPGTLLLFGSGLIGMVGLGRKKLFGKD